MNDVEKLGYKNPTPIKTQERCVVFASTSIRTWVYNLSKEYDSYLHVQMPWRGIYKPTQATFACKEQLGALRRIRAIGFESTKFVYKARIRGYKG